MTGSDILNLIADEFDAEANHLILHRAGSEAAAQLGNSLDRIARNLRTRAAKLDARDREIAAASAAVDEFAGQYAADPDRDRARVLKKYAPPRPSTAPVWPDTYPMPGDNL
jgi:hypothetical protein